MVSIPQILTSFFFHLGTIGTTSIVNYRALFTYSIMPIVPRREEKSRVKETGFLDLFWAKKLLFLQPSIAITTTWNRFKKPDFFSSLLGFIGTTSEEKKDVKIWGIFYTTSVLLFSKKIQFKTHFFIEIICWLFHRKECSTYFI